MRLAYRFISVLVALLVLSSVAQAQTPSAVSSPAQTQSKTATTKAAPSAKPSPAQQAQKLSPVVVTATRIEQPIADIGATISVVEDQQIQDQKIERVSNVLRQVPGVVVTQSGSPGSVTDVSIRGAQSDQTLVLIDGVEVNAAATASFDMANLTTDNLDRVEVLRGAGGSLYGSQAIGGVVNVLSQEGEGPATASIRSSGGNRSSSDQVATLSGSQGNLGYSGAVSYFSTEGYHPVNDNSDNLAMNTRLDYHLGDDTVLRGFARYIASNVSLPNFNVAAFSPLDPTAHQRSEFMLFKGEIEHHFGEKLLVRANSFFVRQDLRVTSTPYPGFTGSEDDRIPDETRGGLAEAIYTWTAGFRTLAGFEFRDLWVRSNSISKFPNKMPPPENFSFQSLFRARQQQYAGYLEQEGSFLDGHLLATGGFRVDGNSQFGKEVSPSWSVAIPIAKISTTLRGSYSEGFRAPTLNELYFPGFGNPKLQPEVSSEYDGGFTTNFGERASLTATYFSRRVKNLIVAVPCTFNAATCPFGSLAGNAARVDTQGVEVVPSLTITDGLTLSGFVTILDETHVDTKGSTARPVRVPKYSASALLAYVHEGNFLQHDRFVANLNYNFVGDRDDITPSGTIANNQAYNLVNAAVSYATGIRLGHVRNEEVFTRVSNLMDRVYFQAIGFRSPSINVLAGVQLDFD
jgi:vitamin B12 transporter